MEKQRPWQFTVKVLLAIAVYAICLPLLILMADVIYTRFFERIPPLRTEVYLQMYEPSVYQRSEIEGLFYELRPNSENRIYKIDSLGMRDYEASPVKNCYRVLIMGDSVTFGPRVRFSQLFTEVAERILNAEEKKVEILNAGVSCYNTRQEFIALRERYLKLDPDLVIFAYSTDDQGEAAIQYLPDDYIQREILKSGIRPKGLHYRNLSEIHYLSLVLPNQFFLRYRLDKWLLLHSGIYRAISIMRFKKRNHIKDLKALPNFLFAFYFDHVLQDIKKLALDNHFSVKFLFLPAAQQWNRGEILDYLTTNEIGLWDFDLAVKEQVEKKLYLWYSDGVHLSPKGHWVVGQLLAEKLSELGL